MRYQNTKTGFVFDSDAECHGEDLIVIEPSPVIEQAEKEKPKKATKKATKKA
jgi:hypothetical protein